MLLLMPSECMPSHVSFPKLHNSALIQADKLLRVDFNNMLLEDMKVIGM